MKIDRYLYFTVEDFVDDSYFRKWVTDPTVHNEQFWQVFLQLHPSKQVTVQEARNLLVSLHQQFEKRIQEIDLNQAMKSYTKFQMKLDKPIAPRKNWIGWIMAASVVLGFVLIGMLWTSRDSEKVVYSTGHGKRMQLILPDESTVELNANSKLTYDPSAWYDEQRRKVYLEGEAFFSIKRKGEGIKFIVHAGEMEISVLGTEFNVRAREEKAQVVLAEGKVELIIADQRFDMIPGDMISYSNINRVVQSKKVQPMDYAAWKDGITVFNNTLLEVAKELESLFGVKFIFYDKSLANRHVQLSAPTDDINQVLEILSLVYKDEIAIDKVEQKIFINIPK